MIAEFRLESRNMIECYRKSIDCILNAINANRKCKIHFNENHLFVEFQNKKVRNCFFLNIYTNTKKKP